LNILVTLSGIPKIADFGIARVLTGRSSSSSGSPAQGGTGNPNFMSPEQARGEPADFLSDLFMVGIIGYLLITNRHPFTHPSGLFSIPELLKDGEYIPESPRGPAILTTSQQRLFREYAAVVMRLLNKEKAGRFSTARDAIDAIDAVTPTLDCPACGERVPEHHKFCGFCGGSLNALKPRSALIPPAALPAGASADELVEEGFQLSRVKQWDAAIELYRRALETDPNHQKAWRNLGYALNRVGRYDEAVRALSSGLSLAPAYPPHLSNFHYERSYAEANLKQYEEALADIETALRYQPDSLRNLYLRARVLLYRGDLEAANRDAHEILKAVPDHAGALRLLDELGEQ
jgi:tetratricopeptide (TPR) repeat protein